jgi:hypothetical protein
VQRPTAYDVAGRVKDTEARRVNPEFISPKARSSRVCPTGGSCRRACAAANS